MIGEVVTANPLFADEGYKMTVEARRKTFSVPANSETTAFEIAYARNRTIGHSLAKTQGVDDMLVPP